MIVKELLLRHTNVGDLVMFYQDGWYFGCTIIDHEDLFMNSLKRNLLFMEVKNYEYEKSDWTIKPVLRVDV